MLPKLDKLPDKLLDKPDVFGRDILDAILMRRKIQSGEITNTPVAGNLENGALCVWAMIDLSKSLFDQQTAMRKAVQLLMEESPAEIHLMVHGNDGEKACTRALGDIRRLGKRSSVTVTENRREKRRGKTACSHRAARL